MKFKHLTSLLIAAMPLTVAAQQIKSSYIDWGVRGSDFAHGLVEWEKGNKWSEDDNFFISRVRPKARFRNAATQINPALNEENDKKLIYWVPINNETFNALPDGVYDSEVFPMWSYITHYGNWSARLLRLPGNFADVAHKNGVPVSGVASVPYGQITTDWYLCLNGLSIVGAEKIADYMEYYGVDGIGYNSEFSTSQTIVKNLRTMHEELLHRLKVKNPLAEIIWYDGTNDRGTISFDRGLSDHNIENWGYGDNIRSSLFFNYNWNMNGSSNLLSQSQQYALDHGRSPLDLYCGINMQGKEPKNWTDHIWTLLKDWNLSIGLWGAHSQNMFFESRAEKGPQPDVRQRTYLKRIEKWFTGGTRNPVNAPAINNSLKIAADNDDFFGMSKFMSARSSLKWDLSEEPFISYFNLGNGKFFNYQGKRCHNQEWYNIGVQDYLPTWMWWFANSFMGRKPSDVATNGLNAEFVWDDAWMGGSLVRVNGSTDTEYLHLFKTEFPVASGDVVTLRYKIINGSAEAELVMSAKGSENTESAAPAMTTSEADGIWVEKKFTIGNEFASLAGKEVAMVALKFKNAKDLDLRLGEFSIVRPGVTATRPATPVIEKAEVLSARHDGFDGKIIFNMPNNKGNDICYNTDVNTSLFKLYAKEAGHEPVLMGMTTSWAGLLFSVPVDFSYGKQVSLGVSAMSLDMTNESEIAWSEPILLSESYEPSDDIVLSKNVIKPGESITVEYADKSHDPGEWIITDTTGKEIASAKNSLSITLADGIENLGNYNLILKGFETIEGDKVKTTRNFLGLIQITDEATGNIPQILNATVDKKDDEVIGLNEGTTEAEISFTANPGEATLSRGLKVGESAMGFKFSDSGLTPGKSFSVSFWLKPDDFKNHAAHLLNIRDKGDKWANNNWGWFWHTVNENGVTDAFTLRMNSGGNVNYQFGNTRIEPGVWHHLAYAFDINDAGEMIVDFYLDGQKQEVTSWTRSDSMKPLPVEPQGDTYSWRKDNVVAVGGFLHNSGSVVGNLDNFMVWNKAITSDDVKKSMGDIDASAYPEGMIALFDFENDHSSDFTFTAQGTKPFVGGSHDYLQTEIEGQGGHYWVEPKYCAGAPMLKGNAFKLLSDVRFFNDGGSVANVSGDIAKGSAKLKFHGTGIYKAGVTVENEYGSDTREFTIHVGNTGVEEVIENKNILEVTPNPFETYIDVTATEDGAYRISLTTLDGKRILVNDFASSAGEKMRVCPEVAAGLYLLSVEKDGKLINSAKVIRK